jgi:hypothetical protein
MKQKLLTLLIILIITGCTATPATVVIPKVDTEGFLKQVDNRLIYNDWPLSLILPASWPIEKFTGEILADAATRSTFVRDPLPGRENSPTLTITFHKIPPGFDAALYSRALQRQQPKYFSTIIKKQIEADGVGVKNSIFYITSREVDGVGQTTYIVHATRNDIGIEVILEVQTDSLEDVSQEFDNILGSLKFEDQ